MLGWGSVQQDFPGLKEISVWLNNLAMQYGYLGIFIASLLGAASVLIPIPYTILIFMLGKILDPNLLAISAGAGAAAGELFGYIMGYFGRALVSEEKKRKMDYMLRVFNRYGSPAIFIFALTPLPDDLIFIPLGIMRYSFIKTFIPCLIGKITMSFILAYSGRLSIGFIEAIFGGEEGSLWTTIITAALLVTILVAMLKVDWEKIFPVEEKKRE
jgi:membrane protein YqaA with SNARE-associated domain